MSEALTHSATADERIAALERQIFWLRLLMVLVAVAVVPFPPTQVIAVAVLLVTGIALGLFVIVRSLMFLFGLA